MGSAVRIQVQFLAPRSGDPQPPVTPAPEDHMLSFALYREPTHDIHTDNRHKHESKKIFLKLHIFQNLLVKLPIFD